MNGLPLLMEDITIPCVNVLWLYLETNDHVFEGRVLQLLTKSGIRELHLYFQVQDEVIIPFVILYYSSTFQHPLATVLKNGNYTWAVKLGNVYTFVTYFGTRT
jgi:hypothetical protein